MPNILSFHVGDRRCGVDILSVRQVTQMVAILPLADAPPAVAGLVNFHGEAVAVIDLRERLGLPLRPYLPSDVLIFLATPARPLALAVEGELEVFPTGEAVPLEKLVPELAHAAVFAAPEGDILLIYDMESFLKRGPGRLDDAPS